jgi:uncharacterized membrane protein (DUF2068 family)
VASRGFWAGWVAFAGLLLMIIGGLDFFQGLIAVIRDQYYVLGDNGALVIDVSQWGWVMMIWGILLAIVGYGLVSGASWARWVAIVGVSLNFLAQLGYDGGSGWTLWSLVVVALNILVLYALIVRWDDAKAAAGL